ncbi:MAG: amidohydrolase [Rikenellaceae bacterium]
MNSILLTNAQILTMEGASEDIFSGFIAIKGDTIAMVGSDNSLLESFVAENPSCRVIDCQGRVVMPGLINTHCHVAMTLQRNLVEDMELMKWLTGYVWPFEALQSDDDIEAGALLGVAEMLLGGVTTFVDMYFSMDRIAEACERLGCRALLTSTLLDARAQEFKSDFERLHKRASSSKLVRAGVAPHAPYTCSPQTLTIIKEVTDEYGTLPSTIHLLETQGEDQMIRDSHGVGAAEYLDNASLLGEQTILAHCVHLDEPTRELIRARACSVAHCPQSNMKLASGIAPLTALHRAGVNCTIATDGVCSNNDLDMWDEMRSAALLARVATMDATAISAYDILRMATVNGAKAIGMEGRLGILAEGALADIIVVDNQKLHHRPRLNTVSSLVYCAKASDVVTTIVNGEVVVHDGQLCGGDIEAIARDVEQRSGRIIDQLAVFSV